MMQSLPFFRAGFYALLILNALIIAALFLLPRFARPSNQGPGGGPLREDFHRLLNLDETQRRTFHQSARKHMRQMDALNREQRQIAPDYFRQLLDTDTATTADPILRKLTQLETAKLEITYAHFAEVKAMLRPDQQEYFSPFLERAVQTVLYTGKSRPRRPRQGPPPRK